MDTNNTSRLLFSSWLKDFCKVSNSPFINESEFKIEEYLRLVESIPDIYEWNVTSVDEFSRKAEEIQTGNMNNLFWSDHAENITAYGIMTMWRGCELVESALRDLNHKKYVSSAVLARSLLELSSAFLRNSNTIRNIENITFEEGVIVVSTELEEAVLKMIWGSRQDNTEKYLHQTNVITHINKISQKVPELIQNYEYLCEIAHPNHLGNVRFWSHVEVKKNQKRLIISKGSESNDTKQIIEKTLWSLCWSSMALKNSYQLLNNSVNVLKNNMKEV